MIEHLPALLIVLPMVGAPLNLLVRSSRLSWLLSSAILATALGISLQLVQRVMATGPVAYEMGGWAAPVGITYHIDAVGAFVTVIVTLVSFVAMLYARRSVDDELPADVHYLFYAAWLLCTTGLLGMTVTGDAFNVFVFLEISSLSSYVLIGLGRDRRALTAALQYLIMGSIGGTFILVGIGLMYAMTGTLNMADLAVRLGPVMDTRAVLVSFAFITVGASLKLALWPLHFWLPNAYTYAPSAVSAFISATSTKVMVYVLMRFALTIYGVDFSFGELHLGMPLMCLSLAGIWVASTVAVFQGDLKRLLAYSSVGQIGYMILGLSLATVGGVTAAVLHLFNHAVIKAGMFLAVGNVVYRTGSSRLHDLRGVGRVMPWSTAAFILGGFGLIGVPLTVGFTSKWVLITATLAEGHPVIAVAALLSSLLAVAYVWRFVEAAWFHEPSEALANATEAPVSMLIPTWLLVGASVWFGVAGQPTMDVAQAAAQRLLGGL